MTTPTPTPQEENSPADPESKESRPNPADTTGFFNRVRQNLKPEEEKAIHPSEAAEIVIMEDEG